MITTSKNLAKQEPSTHGNADLTLQCREFYVSPPLYPAVCQDILDGWQCCQYFDRNIVCCRGWPFPAGIIRVTYDDPADHRSHLVGDTVVIVDARCLEGHLGALSGQEKTGIPRFGGGRYPPQAVKVDGMVSRGSVTVALVSVDKAYRRPGLNRQAGWRVPDAFTPRGTTHFDHFDRCG